MPPLPPAPAPRQAIVSVAPQTPLLGDAERDLLTTLDEGNPPVRPANIPAPDLPAYDWLWNAAAWQPGQALPANPFPKGSAAAREAQAWRAFLAQPAGSPCHLPLALTGSQLLLWSWLHHRDRAHPLPPSQRQALEDRLMAGNAPVLRGWALRHALCFALAERDSGRFSALKAAHGSQAPETFAGAQALFGLLGGPSPAFRLWSLPGLTYRDADLGALGARQIWICPPGPPAPAGAVWIIPSQSGVMSGRETDLSPTRKEEAAALAPALHGRAAWFAPSKAEWEAVGLSWFPILITLDKDGAVARVQMGDAAP